MFETFQLYTVLRKAKEMGKDLFQISKAKNVYSVLDTWAMLSPKLAFDKSNKALLDENKKEPEIKGENGID